MKVNLDELTDREQELLDVLPIGYENSLSGTELGDLISVNRVEIKAIVKQLRRKGYGNIVSNRNGYYIARKNNETDMLELKKASNKLINYGRAQITTGSLMKKWHEENSIKEEVNNAN